MSNEQIYYYLKDLGVIDAQIAGYLAEKTGRSKHSWKVKISNGVALTEYKRNAKIVEEFNKYAKEFLDDRVKVYGVVMDEIKQCEELL